MEQQVSLSELGVRLRHFQCQNLEDMICGLFERCSLVPFGSTVTGLGQYDCDLDISLNIHGKGSKEVHVHYISYLSTH